MHIEKEKFNIITVMIKPKYKRVTFILLVKMILLGLSGNFAMAMCYNLIIKQIANREDNISDNL